MGSIDRFVFEWYTRQMGTGMAHICPTTLPKPYIPNLVA